LISILIPSEVKSQLDFGGRLAGARGGLINR
jgi:hypothetical protein